eukprot:Hpha_TRINITY_DN16088_c7_g10::TRINITY_DN16088_c7_g10_i1::g.121595::m.121595
MMRERVARCCEKCSDWALRDSDTAHDANTKRILIPVVLSCLPFLTFMIYRVYVVDQNPVKFCAFGLYFAGLFQILPSAHLGLRMRPFVGVMVTVVAVAILLHDLTLSAEMQPRMWSQVVLVLDAALVFETRSVVPIVLILTLTYLLMERVEAGLRFGLFDEVRNDDTPLLCDCARPPCATGAVSMVNAWVGLILILLIDFYLTRGFATDLRQQLRSVKASVKVAGEVAAALARYDVDVADTAIAGGKDLPEELGRSYAQLLYNLRSYKAYLPHSCLVTKEEADSESECEEGANSIGRLTTDDIGITTIPPTPPGEGLQAGLADRQRRSSFRFTQISDEGSSNPSIASHQDRMVVRRGSLKARPKRARVTLAAGNMIGYLSSFEDLAGKPNYFWIESDVEQWCDAVVAVRGLVDLIGGDRRYASFNARQTCEGHASAAVGVLFSRGEMEPQPSERAWSGCTVTGQAVCGDFGSSSVLRFMVMG